VRRATRKGGPALLWLSEHMLGLHFVHTNVKKQAVVRAFEVSAAGIAVKFHVDGA
jgi:hypothetical protein